MTEQNQLSGDPREVEPRYHADEIDLTDLVLALWRRRWVFLVTFVVVFGLGLAYAFLATEKYQYHTTIEIGHVLNGLDLEPIEKADALKDRLKRVYIPSVIYQAQDEAIHSLNPKSVEITAPDDSGVVELNQQGPADAERQIVALLNRVTNSVTTDHNRIFDLAKASRETALTQARNELKSLKTKESLIQANLERTKQSAELLKENIDGLQSAIDTASAQRQEVVKSASADQKAMTLLLIDNQIQNDRLRLDNLQEQLQVGLEKEQDELRGKLSDNQNAQENQQMEIKSLEAQASAMERTRVLIPPTRSANPVSPNKQLVLSLGFVLGGFLALLAVGLSALIASAAKKQSLEDAD